MSVGLIQMWISFVGMILLFMAIGLIILSRYKLKGILRGIVSALAYICLATGGLIIFYIVLSVPA